MDIDVDHTPYDRLAATLRLYAPDPVRAVRWLRRSDDTQRQADERDAYCVAFRALPGVKSLLGHVMESRRDIPQALVELVVQMAEPTGQLQRLRGSLDLAARRLGPLDPQQLLALNDVAQTLVRVSSEMSEAHAPTAALFPRLLSVDLRVAISLEQAPTARDLPLVERQVLQNLADQAAHVLAHGRVTPSTDDADLAVEVIIRCHALGIEAIPDGDMSRQELDVLASRVSLGDKLRDKSRNRPQLDEVGVRRILWSRRNSAPQPITEAAGDTSTDHQTPVPRRVPMPNRLTPRTMLSVKAMEDYLEKLLVGELSNPPAPRKKPTAISPPPAPCRMWPPSGAAAPTDPPLGTATEDTPDANDRTARKGSAQGTRTRRASRPALTPRVDNHGCLPFSLLPLIVKWLTARFEQPEVATLTVLSRTTACSAALVLTIPWSALLRLRVGTAAEAGRGVMVYSAEHHSLYVADRTLRGALATGARVKKTVHVPAHDIIHYHVPAGLDRLIRLCIARCRDAGGDPCRAVFWVVEDRTPRPLSQNDIEKACATWSAHLFAPVHAPDFQRAGRACTLLPDAPASPLMAALLSGDPADLRRATAYLGMDSTLLDHRTTKHEAFVVAHVLERQRALGLTAEDMYRTRTWLLAPSLPSYASQELTVTTRVAGSRHVPLPGPLAARRREVRAQAARVGDMSPDALLMWEARLDVEIRLGTDIRQQDIRYLQRSDVVILAARLALDQSGTIIVERYGLRLQGKGDGVVAARPRIIAVPRDLVPLFDHYLELLDRAKPNDITGALLPHAPECGAGLEHPDALRHLATMLTEQMIVHRKAPVADVMRVVQWYLGHDILDYGVTREGRGRGPDCWALWDELYYAVHNYLEAYEPREAVV